LLSRKDAPRGQILRLPLAHLDLADAKVIVSQTSGPAAAENARASMKISCSRPDIFTSLMS